MEKVSKRLRVWILALLGVLAVVLIGPKVYAAVNDQAVNKIGDYYCVDTVTAETTADGVLVQTIERKWIPVSRYNANDPRNPLPIGTVPVTEEITKLRTAAAASITDLQQSGYAYQWSTAFAEASATNTELHYTVSFQVDETVSADRWLCSFDQVTRFDRNGNAYVEYWKDGVKYSTNSIKRMFATWGKAR